MMDEDSSSKFIGSLTKFLQSLCNGYVEFQSGVELAGHIYLSVDTGKKIDYILHEKVCKNDENSVTFISNSFHAQPIEKAKSAVNHQRSDSSPKPKDLPKSTRDGEILEGKRKKDEEDDDDLVIVESQGTQPESTNIGTVQSKMPHHDRIGPRGLKRVGSPSASQRLNQRSSAQRNNNPVSSTISSSTSPAHQSNQGSGGSMFPSQSNTRQQSAVPSATVTSQGEIQADNFNMGDMKLEQMTTDELLALTSQVNDDSSSSVQALSSSQLQHTSSGSSSGGVEQTGSGQVWVKQEVSDDDICMQGQSGSTGLGSGWPRRQDGLRGAGGNSGGLYPVMLHQNTAAFSGPNTAFPPGFPPLGVGSSQHPGFSQLPSSSQAAGLLPTSLPGSSHDAVGVDQTVTGEMDEAMETAIAAVMTHGMSFRKASKDFGVKVTRLFHAVQRRRGQISKPRRPHLTREDEERLIDHGFQVARFGRRFARMSMKEMAAKMAEKNGQPFKNSLPCDVWWLKFLNKHAGLTAALNETWKAVDQPQPNPY